MNPSPRKHGVFITPQTDGILAMRNVEDAFWQSRMTTAGHRAELPNLVSLHDLARKIRATTDPDLIAAYADAFPGIPARAITPTGSFNPSMDRSDVAAAPGTRRWLHQNSGHRYVESGCGYAKAQTAQTCFAPTYTGPNFGGWPNP